MIRWTEGTERKTLSCEINKNMTEHTGTEQENGIKLHTSVRGKNQLHESRMSQ